MAISLAEKSYLYIRQKLERGEMPLGSQLVNRTLAAEIGVSVIPVREAIHRLATEGLIEHRPGAGAYVPNPSGQDLDNLYVLRDAIESCAAGEAAQHISDFQLQQLRSIVSESSQLAKEIGSQRDSTATKEQFDRWVDLEKQFHELLIEASRNSLLVKVIHEHRAISDIFESQRRESFQLKFETAEETCLGKAEILDALTERDSQRVRQLISEQIQNGRKMVLCHLRKRST
jgi:DNA-binding GntR family transcriptional regulator